MRFTFKCHVARHPSGRVTVTPIDFPGLAVHAVSLERACEELTLGFDDRISRAHPRHLFELVRPAGGEGLVLAVKGLVVRRAAEDEVRALRVLGLRAPAHRPFVEVRAPRLDGRLWLKGKDLGAEAEELFAAQIEGLDEALRLDLRADGPEEWHDLVVDATPVRLADLKRSELVLDERPPPNPYAETDPDDADWDDARKRRPMRPARPRRPATPTLSSIAVPWHTLAAEGALDPAYERDAMVEALRQRLAIADPEPIVLVGAAGVGKTAIVAELARRLAEAERPKPEKERDPRPLFYADAARLTAGHGFFGEWQGQVLAAVKEARAAGAVILVDHVVHLLDAGKSAHSDQNVAQLLAPVLAARELVLIGEATPEEWAEVERRNAALARAFSVLRVEEPDDAATARILARTGETLGAAHGLAILPAAMVETQSLAARFMPYGARVGNACAFLRRLALRRAHALASRVDAGDALAQFSSETGIPRRLLDDREPLDESDVRAFLAERVKGQPEAVLRVAQTVSIVKANLADRRRPSAVLLFSGPTGVGKTELAKALAELLFGARDRMVRLDMAEYAGPDALARLLGEGGLAAAVRPRPFCVVLLDEIEKAHPAVFDALLGVLGEGRLTDVRGRTADLRGAVFILTSNLGADTWRARPGFGGSDGDGSALLAHYRAEAQRFFRPELWNRLDDLVVFRALGSAQVRAIVDREVERIVRREGLRRRDTGLVVDEAARDLLAARGLDPRYGARPLKRTLERELVAPVSAYLAGHPEAGATRLEVGAEADGLRFAASSLPRDEASRAHIERVLDRAALLRAEVRRWARSAPMRRLKQELAMFERQSRLPSFWQDRALADERARAAAEGRDLIRDFLAAERQVEAAEDLAYEAYFGRQPATLIYEELDTVERALLPLCERVYASLFPPRNTVRLVMMAGRGAWPHLVALCDAVRRWAQRRGCTPQSIMAVEVAAKEKPSGKKAPPVEHRWKERPIEDKSPHAAAMLVVSGARSAMLLAAEHGAHRFTAGGTTSVVKVRFEPGPFTPPADLKALEGQMPAEEIRRVWPDKGVVEDLRLKKRFDYSAEVGIHLEPLLDGWQRMRVFSSTGEDA